MGLLVLSLSLLKRWKVREIIRLKDALWLTDWSRDFCPDPTEDILRIAPGASSFPVLIQQGVTSYLH